ncbi:MAG: hypothetical protein AB7S26_28810 [Sandaracinaceae bacterium]
MAKKGKIPPPKDPNEALREMEKPEIKWRSIGLIVAAFVVLWATAAMMYSYSEGGVLGYVSLGVVGVLTIVAIGFGIYIWRLTKRSRGIADILAEATDAEGRKRALEKLEAGDGKDALNALARAQLVSRESPLEAVRILEGVDIDKAPAVVQDDVRCNLALLYLMQGKAKEARDLADKIRLDRQPNAKAKGLYAAVCAEAFARTGSPHEADKLLETYDADDASFGEVQALLYRAQVYAAMANKKRGRAQTAMNRLAKLDPNQLAPFLGKGARPIYASMAQKALKAQGMAPKPKMKIQRR